MKITRSADVKSQIKHANSAKRKLLRLIQKKREAAQKLGVQAEEWQNLSDELSAVSEVFSVTTKTVPYVKVNRRGCLLSGPFFVSKEFPIPIGATGQMHPLVQFDLAILSKALSDDCGSGLLQLWYDTKSQKELIRIIPMAAIETQDLLAFQVEKLSEDDAFPLPFWMELDPVKNGVQVISGLVSSGVDSGGDLFDIYCDLFADAKDLIRLLLIDFAEMTPVADAGNFSVAGTLHVIQYNYSDIKMRQLLRFSGWGSSGSAEIFFKSNKDAPPKFSFSSCVR
jgi:hypothetical protein